MYRAVDSLLVLVLPRSWTKTECEGFEWLEIIVSDHDLPQAKA